MNVVSAETIRRLLPGLAVLAVLAFSFFAASPSLASSTNNCGVKGNGYHDHGKVCPNRPFPGQGKGLTEAVEGTQAEGSGTTTKVSGQVSPGSIKHKSAVSVNATVAAAVTESDTSTSDGSARVSGHAHGSVHGHSNGHGQGD